MAHLTAALVSGPTMNPGVSMSETIGKPCASQSCMNRAALSAASASMAPRGGPGCWRAGHRAALIRASAVTTPRPKPARNSSIETTSTSHSIDAADLVDAQPAGWQQLAHCRGIARRPVRSRPWNIPR
jgi:hypothetical protein